jgi:hypothetical protein
MIPGGLTTAREMSALQNAPISGVLERGGILSVDESKPQAKD